MGEAGSTTVTYTVTSGTFQNETITGGTSSVAKVVSAVTASTTYRGNDDGFGTSVSLHGKWLAVGGAITGRNLGATTRKVREPYFYTPTLTLD